MRALAIQHQRERDIMKFAQSKMASVGILPRKVQATTFRCFAELTGTDRSIVFNLSAGDGKSVAKEVENLLTL